MPRPSVHPLRDNRATVPRVHMRPQSGFTLLELLVVTAVLAVLAGVAVLAVGRLRGTSQEVACDLDARTIDTAQAAYGIDEGRPGSEAELVGAGYLAEESQYHDVLVGAESYDLVAVGGCATVETPNTLSTGKRIQDPGGGDPRPRLAPIWPPVMVPCAMLTRDTGDRFQNPVPCNDGRFRKHPDRRIGQDSDGAIRKDPDRGIGTNPDRGLRRAEPGDRKLRDPANGERSCGPNRICDADMAPGTKPGR